ncbi:hypothetical protein ACKVWC_011498 [Pyricularia oryzae]
MDIVLSVDSGDTDANYKIQRGNGRIVYVQIPDTTGFLAENERNYGPKVVEKLSKLEEWKDDSWATLQYNPVTRQCAKDLQPPHAIPKDKLLSSYSSYDMADLHYIKKIKSRTCEVFLNGQTYVFKTARFPFELPWIVQEIEAYHTLEGTSLAPRLIGYVFETSQDRVTGILLEKLEGHFPESGDLDTCLKALDQLHSYLAHGDLVKYNIIMTSKGPRFLDFESSVLVSSDAWSTELSTKDRQKLADNLGITSDHGRPYE